MRTNMVSATILAIYAGILSVQTEGPKSGLEVGQLVTPFHPTHVGGPDNGTDTCPP